MITNINEILIEWAYRTKDGQPNPKSMSHQIILEGLLKDFGWSREERSELIGNLMEAERKYVDNVKNRALGRVGLAWGSKGTPPEKEEPKDDEGKGKPKKSMTKDQKRRAERVEKDIEEINQEPDPDKRTVLMKKKQEQRRKEIYEGKDLPAGNSGSTLGEMGGGMAAEDIGDPDNPNVTEEEWVEQEHKKIMDADPSGLKEKLCEGKPPNECEKVIKEWLGVAYRTGLNELNALKNNPNYKAEWPQPEPYPSGHIMDYHGKEMAGNELEQRKKACDKLGNDGKYRKDRKECHAHYDKQLAYLESLEETDTGVLYMMEDGNLGFKHTSNKKSLKDPHNNKTIESKKKSMEESGKRQEERGDFDSETITTVSAAISTAMDGANKIVRRADRQAAADVEDVEDQGALVSGAGSLINKLPGRGATKGDKYADKVRKGGDGYAAIRKELKRLGIDVVNATDEEVLQATLNVIQHGSQAPTKAEKAVNEKIASGEEQPIEFGKDRSGNPVYYQEVEVPPDGEKEIRQCDAEGNPIAPNGVGKLVYKVSELIKTTRNKAEKLDPPLTEDSTDEELEEFGKFYTPPLSADEVKWMLFSEEADTLENTNDDRKSGNDRAHQKVVDECKKEDQKWFSKNPVEAENMGWRQREDGTWEPDPDKPTKNGPATQQYVDSYMEDMHWNRYIDGDHDGVGDMSINGQNVQPADFRTCLTKLSGHVKQNDDESDDDYAKRVDEYYKDPANREELKKHLREQTRISAEVEASEESDDQGRITKESQEAHISFDTETDEVKRGKKTGRKRKVSVGEEAYRSKGVGNNSVLGGLGLDMQSCLQGEMDRGNK